MSKPRKPWPPPGSDIPETLPLAPEDWMLLEALGWNLAKERAKLVANSEHTITWCEEPYNPAFDGITWCWRCSCGRATGRAFPDEKSTVQSANKHTGEYPCQQVSLNFTQTKKTPSSPPGPRSRKSL